MPHNNYCQQCGKSVELKEHDKTHVILKDVLKVSKAEKQKAQSLKDNLPEKD